MSFVDDLIETYVPVAKEFTVNLSAGEAFTFRVIQSYIELKDLRSEGAKFLAMVRKGRVPADYAEYTPPDTDAGNGLALAAYYMSKTLVSPTLGVFELMKLAYKAPFVFETLNTQLDQGQTVQRMETEAEEIEESKKELPVTGAGETV